MIARRVSMFIGGVAAAALLAPAHTPAADPHHAEKGHHGHAEKGHAAHAEHREGGAGIPESMKVEHAAIHRELVAATKLKGRVGDAARELAGVLHAHFVREEEIALPPLGLLRALAKGPPTPEMREVLAMTDALVAELPHMLEEHVKIAAAARKLEAVAREEKNAKVATLARELQLHAQAEEEVFYPAAVLVGKMLKGQG